ncbi:MAG: endo alpha-1,4 polygalactosaminidase [Chloroflexi bacterium]|nr:endo alpha-1,4 polygalactosaminidase [Chloroflexota bacterium]
MRQYLIVLVFGLTAALIAGCTPPLAEPMPAATTTTPPPFDWWHPTSGLTWQWQLTGKFDLDIKTDVYDIDLHVHESAVDHFHAQGARVICYISVGSHENWRADADQFPEEVIGKDYEGWSGEKWLDIRRIDLLSPIMRARLDMCAAKGFDGVEPDNMETYTNDTGFPLTYEDQLQFALWLAEEAHQRGLAIGQKNAPDQTSDLVDIYDFAIIEDAFHYRWAEDMAPYVLAGKPVFAAEYTDLPGDFAEYCRQSRELGFSTILKNRNLGAWIETCP